MKKLTGWLTVAAVAAMVLVGCSLNPEQISALAQSAGTATTVVWIGYDAPTTKQKVEVEQVLTMVQTNIGIVGTNSYVAVLYPKVFAYVAANTNIPAADQPLVDAGALAILGGVDMMFAAHPDWKANTQQVGVYVSAFISGANLALALPSNDAQITSATVYHHERLGLKR